MASQLRDTPTDSFNEISIGTVGWSDLSGSDVFAQDAAVASLTLQAGEITNYCAAFFPTPAIPADATVVGIVCEVYRTGSSGVIADHSVRLLKAGAPVGDDKSAGAVWGEPDNYASFGGPTDLWGTTWTAAEVNAIDFGFGASAVNTDAVVMANPTIDHMRLTVYYTAPDRPGPRESVFRRVEVPTDPLFSE